MYSTDTNFRDVDLLILIEEAECGPPRQEADGKMPKAEPSNVLFDDIVL